MGTAALVIGLIVVLLWIVSGWGSGGAAGGEDRYYTGADYEPTHHQVLRSNVFGDKP
jgi:hypothetical protein